MNYLSYQVWKIKNSISWWNQIRLQRIEKRKALDKALKSTSKHLKINSINNNVVLYHLSNQKFLHFDKRFFNKGQGGSVYDSHFFGGNKYSALYWKNDIKNAKYLYEVLVPKKYVNYSFNMGTYKELEVAHKYEKKIKINDIIDIDTNKSMLEQIKNEQAAKLKGNKTTELKIAQAKKVSAIQAKEGFFKSSSNLIKGIPKSGKIGMIIGLGLLAGININEYMFSAKKKSGYRSKNQETKNIDFLIRGY